MFSYLHTHYLYSKNERNLMPHTLYKTQGTCSQFIDVAVDEECVIR